MATDRNSWSKPPVYPAVLIRFLPEGSRPTRVPVRLFLVRRVCDLCHPGATPKPTEASFFVTFRKVLLGSELPAHPYNNHSPRPPGAEAPSMVAIRDVETRRQK
jgi:hypothetical protein